MALFLLYHFYFINYFFLISSHLNPFKFLKYVFPTLYLCITHEIRSFVFIGFYFRWTNGYFKSVIFFKKKLYHATWVSGIFSDEKRGKTLPGLQPPLSLRGAIFGYTKIHFMIFMKDSYNIGFFCRKRTIFFLFYRF